MRFSERYPWQAEENRLTRLLRERAAAGLPIADLSVSNPTRVGLTVALELGSRYDPAPAGGIATREAIARYYREEFGVELSPRRIQLCASTSEGYSYCLKLLADPGDEVLIPEPSYPLLEHLIRAEGVVAIPYATHYAAGEWVLDRERLQGAIGPRTKAIVLVHPNNPTGHFWSAEDLEWLPPQLPRISDEVFADYAWEAPPAPRTLAASGAFCLSGLSKVCALPQMKLGWIVMPEEEHIVRAMEFIGDTYLSVSAPIQEAAPTWLARRDELQAPVKERCRQNLAWLYAQRGLAVDRVGAGWCAIVRTSSGGDEEEMAARLIERGFWLHPGYYYDLPMREAWVLSLLTQPERLEAGIGALSAL